MRRTFIPPNQWLNFIMYIEKFKYLFYSKFDYNVNMDIWLTLIYVFIIYVYYEIW